MQDLILKEFQDKSIRISKDEKNNLWFVAKDVMDVLGIKHTASALRKLQNEEKSVITMHTPSGEQQMSGVTESGMYALIFQSRKKEASKFRYWITNEVLPSIRKTGSFSMKEIDPLDQLKMHIAVMEKQRSEIRQLNAKLDVVEVEAKQDHDTLTSKQIEDLSRAISVRAKEVGHVKMGSIIKREIKKAFFAEISDKTFKEIPRSGLEKALNIARNLPVPNHIKMIIAYEKSQKL